MKTVLRLPAAILALLAAIIALPAAAQDFPELTGRVVDAANIIPDAQEAELAAQLEALETQSQRQFVIATLPDLQGYDISDYGYQLGRAWELGDAERDDGILLIVAPNERKTRIEVGYGLEGIMTDALSSIIINQQMVPRFREGDYAGGIDAAASSIITQLTLPEDEARAVAAQTVPQRTTGNRGGAVIDFPTIIFLGFFLFFIIIPMLRGKNGRKYRGKGRGNGTLTGSGVGDIILWEVGSAVLRGAVGGGRSGGGGFGSGGGFGGGGFSGGGGSFGGGGASGGW